MSSCLVDFHSLAFLTSLNVGGNLCMYMWPPEVPSDSFLGSICATKLTSTPSFTLSFSFFLLLLTLWFGEGGGLGFGGGSGSSGRC